MEVSANHNKYLVVGNEWMHERVEFGQHSISKSKTVRLGFPFRYSHVCDSLFQIRLLGVLLEQLESIFGYHTIYHS